MKRTWILTAAILMVVLCVGGLAGYYVGSQSQSQSQTQNPTELRVFIAATLNTVVAENKEQFETENNVKLLVNAANSDGLYAQIVAGSPADVYVAADFKWLDKLKKDGLLYQDKYWNFTTNTLVVFLPTDNPKNIVSLLDLVKPGVRIVVTGWNAPVGKYTNTTLNKIDSTWGNPSSPNYEGTEWENYKTRFIQNIVSYEANVEQVVGKVVLGNCDAGVAYASDATTMGGSKLKQIQIPAEVNTVGTFAIGVVEASSHPDLAMKYVNFWLSNEGQDLLRKYGFGQTLSVAASALIESTKSFPTSMAVFLQTTGQPSTNSSDASVPSKSQTYRLFLVSRVWL